jgi:hypothetical protein
MNGRSAARDGGCADGGCADGGFADGSFADGGFADGSFADGSFADGRWRMAEAWCGVRGAKCEMRIQNCSFALRTVPRLSAICHPPSAISAAAIRHPRSRHRAQRIT